MRDAAPLPDAGRGTAPSSASTAMLRPSRSSVNRLTRPLRFIFRAMHFPLDLMLTSKHTVFMTNTNPTRDELMARLLNAQNHPANWHIDITSIVSIRPVMDDAQLLTHLTYYEAKVAQWQPKRRARRAA